MTELLLLALPIFLFVAGIILVLLGYSIGRQRFSNRNIGEVSVVAYIRKRFSQPYHLFNNVTLKTDDGTTQIDHILVASNGIFVIETKHYSGWIFGSPKSKTWQQSIYRKKTKFQNPIFQNEKHIRVLKSLFSLPDDHFKNLVVFTGTAEFKTDLGDNVIRLHELENSIAKPTGVEINETKMTYIVGRIEMNRLQRSLETDEYHRNYLETKHRRKHSARL